MNPTPDQAQQARGSRVIHGQSAYGDLLGEIGRAMDRWASGCKTLAAKQKPQARARAVCAAATRCDRSRSSIVSIPHSAAARSFSAAVKHYIGDAVHELFVFGVHELQVFLRNLQMKIS